MQKLSHDVCSIYLHLAFEPSHPYTPESYAKYLARLPRLQYSCSRAWYVVVVVAPILTIVKQSMVHCSLGHVDL